MRRSQIQFNNKYKPNQINLNLNSININGNINNLNSGNVIEKLI